MKKTPLYDIHCKLGGKMVEFGGWQMPVQYTGIVEEHKRVRSTVGLFDVSHMGEIEVWGDKAEDFVNYVTVNDVKQLQVNQGQYTCFCYENGGIVDDLLVFRLKDHFLMVVNASNTDKDYEWLKSHLQSGVELKNVSDETVLIALQGRNAVDVLSKVTDLPVRESQKNDYLIGKINDIPVGMSRTGYTGEDGFEIACANEYGEKLWNTLMSAGKEYQIAPIGLGARDTLRLEMKYCLYGNDIDKDHTPLEAGLGWIVKFDKGDFIGRDVLLKQKEEGVKRKLIGFEMIDKGIPRQHYPIMKNNEQIGEVTSGSFSPSLNVGIGLGYVKTEFSKTDTEIEIDVRGKRLKAKIVKTPFYKS